MDRLISPVLEWNYWGRNLNKSRLILPRIRTLYIRIAIEFCLLIEPLFERIISFSLSGNVHVWIYPSSSSAVNNRESLVTREIYVTPYKCTGRLSRFVVVRRSSCRLGSKSAVNMEKNGCINHASSKHFFARKRAKVPPLFRLESCPPWLQFNKYILAGYRCHLSTSQCVNSLFYIHNETFNIYSHGKYEGENELTLLTLADLKNP